MYGCGKLSLFFVYSKCVVLVDVVIKLVWCLMRVKILGWILVKWF